MSCHPRWPTLEVRAAIVSYVNRDIVFDVVNRDIVFDVVNRDIVFDVVNPFLSKRFPIDE